MRIKIALQDCFGQQLGCDFACGVPLQRAALLFLLTKFSSFDVNIRWMIPYMFLSFHGWFSMKESYDYHVIFF